MHFWNIRKVFTWTLGLAGDQFCSSLPSLLKVENQRKSSNSVKDVCVLLVYIFLILSTKILL